MVYVEDLFIFVLRCFVYYLGLVDIYYNNCINTFVLMAHIFFDALTQVLAFLDGRNVRLHFH